MNFIDISIIIPFYNEEESVVYVIEELVENFLRKGDFSLEIIAVNNGSNDKTKQLLEDFRNPIIKVININQNIGFSHGICSGIRIATGKLICFFGGDGQTNPQDVIDMISKSKNIPPKTLVSGFRVERDDNFLRHFISLVFNQFFRFLYKSKVKDINGTPKIMHYGDFMDLDIQSQKWFIDAEIIIKAERLKMNIVQIPIVFRKRIGGKTHINIHAIFDFLHNMIMYKILK